MKGERKIFVFIPFMLSLDKGGNMQRKIKTLKKHKSFIMIEKVIRM